jgi:hypothetical protein
MTAGTLNAGDWQAQAQAPVSMLPAERSRYIGGHHVRGAWSDPWWLARPGGGFAVTRRWRSKAQTALSFDTAARRYRTVPVPAVDERVTEPWEGSS